MGNSLCGVGCYVRSNVWLLRGREWGTFIEAKINAAELYRKQIDAERAWARRTLGSFSIFLASSTEPFQPAERKFGVTRSVLLAMLDEPPDELIVQTHSAAVVDALDVLVPLSRRTRLRVHVSIETDRERIDGLPPPGATVAKRIDACRLLREAGLHVVVTVAPLLPIAAPESFFAELSQVADAVVIDHYIGGDGSPDGSRTRRTSLPLAMSRIEPASTTLAYRDAIIAVARRYFANVGIGIDGFAGRFSAANDVSVFPARETLAAFAAE